MTRGIEVNQIIRVKSSGQLGRVVAVDDHHDRFPADLQLVVSDLSMIKIRVDEVETIIEFLNKKIEDYSNKLANGGPVEIGNFPTYGQHK